MRAWSIARKELREAFRDRRSLLSGLFYGIWGPLVMAYAMLVMAQQQADIGAFEVEARGAGHAPSLVGFLATRDITVTDAGRDVAGEVRPLRRSLALIIDEHYEERFQASRRALVTIVHDSTRSESSRKAGRLRAVLEEYSRRVGDTRLVIRGVSPDISAPLRILERDYATLGERAARTLAMVPIFVLLAAFIGGMSMAADVGAGERERGSLESLLLHPVSGAAIAGGKWLAVSLLALLTEAVALTVTFLVLQHPRLQAVDLPIGMTLTEAVQLAALTSPLALAIAAIQLCIGFRAHTFKEAQTQLSMLIFVPMIPGFLFAFGSIRPAAWMGITPLLGHHLAILRLLQGETLSGWQLATLSAITCGLGCVGWMAAARQLGRPEILRRART